MASDQQLAEEGMRQFTTWLASKTSIDLQKKVAREALSALALARRTIYLFCHQLLSGAI